MVMTFTNRDLICGVHALCTHELFSTGKKTICLLDATYALHTTRATAQAVMEHFQQAGYLELIPDDPDAEVWQGPSWPFVKGPKGKMLAPRYPWPLSGDEAKTAIGHAHDAICSVNTGNEFRMVSIDEVRLFGEALYCSNHPYDNEIYRLDVAIKISPRTQDREVQVAAQADMPRMFDFLQEGQTHLCLYQIGARQELIAV